MNEYFLEPKSSVELDLSNSNLSNLKFNVDKLDTDKFKNVPS